jgi:hypothetical protein
MCATGFFSRVNFYIFEAQNFRCVCEIKEDVKLTETLLSILTSHSSIFFQFTVVYEEKDSPSQLSKGTVLRTVRVFSGHRRLPALIPNT